MPDLWCHVFRNSISASAVCAFNLSAITQAFNGPFHYQENPRSAWLSSPNPLPNFQVTCNAIRPRFPCRRSPLTLLVLQCGTLDEGGPGGNLTERSLQDAQRFFLMSDVVQPVTVNPLLAQDNLRFSRMVVDVVQGRGARYHVMYIATGETLIVAATELPPTWLE